MTVDYLTTAEIPKADDKAQDGIRQWRLSWKFVAVCVLCIASRPVFTQHELDVVYCVMYTEGEGDQTERSPNVRCPTHSAVLYLAAWNRYVVLGSQGAIEAEWVRAVYRRQDFMCQSGLTL